MKRAFLAAILAFAPAATAASDLFGVYLVSTADSPGARKATLIWPGGAVEIVYLDSAPLLEASAIAAADVETGPGGVSQMRLVLTAEGARKLSELTSRNVGRRLGIVVDGQLRSAPFVTGSMSKDIVVVGSFTPLEASALAKKLGPPSASIRLPGASPQFVAPDAAVLRNLQGTWTVLNATVNSRVVPDPKFGGGTWTFDGGTVTATNGVGQTERFALRTDAASPAALHLEPLPPSNERALWIFFKRESERLTVAFFDGSATRPEDFSPAPKKVVLVLARQGRTATPSPCDILGKAGMASLLPGGVREPERERRGGGPACVFADPSGREVLLLLVPGADRAVFEAEAKRLRPKAPQALRQEPELGRTAVSVARGYHVTFLVLEKETLLALVFQLPGVDIATLREFTRRVLAEIRE